jgi:hypothetical protein
MQKNTNTNIVLLIIKSALMSSINQHKISYNDWQWFQWLEISTK